MDPFKSVDFDEVDETIVEVLSQALKRWPGDLTRAAAEFKIVIGGIFQEMVAAEIATAYMRGVTSTIAYIIDAHADHAFVADCIAFAANLHALQGGLSQTDLGARHGVDKATVNKWVGIVREDLNLPPPRGGRDEEAIESYRRRAHDVHGTEPGDRQPKRKIETFESLLGKFCRWISVEIEALRAQDAPAMVAALEQFRESLFAIEAALPPPR